MPCVHSYVKRVHNKPISDLEMQSAICAMAVKQNLLKLDHTFKNGFCDAIELVGVPYRRPFLERPRAAALVKRLVPGDVVLIGDWRKAFPNVSDAVQTLRHFQAIKCRLVLFDLKLLVIVSDSDRRDWRQMFSEALRETRKRKAGTLDGKPFVAAEWRTKRSTRGLVGNTTMRRKAIAQMVIKYRQQKIPWAWIPLWIDLMLRTRKDGLTGHSEHRPHKTYPRVRDVGLLWSTRALQELSTKRKRMLRRRRWRPFGR